MLMPTSKRTKPRNPKSIKAGPSLEKARSFPCGLFAFLASPMSAPPPPLSRIRRLLACLLPALGLAACVPHVQPLPHPVLFQLHQSAVPGRPSDFHRGHWQTAPPALHLPPGSELRLPLETDHALPKVELSLNQTPLPWFLDTGAAFPVVLDAHSARKASLPLLQRSQIEGKGVGGTAQGLLARFEALRLDAQPLTGNGLALVLLNEYHLRFAGIPWSRLPVNLIGLPLLERFSYLTLDGPAQEARLGVQRPFTPAPGSASFPFESKQGRIWVKLRVAERSLHAVLDTGYAGNLRLPAESARSLPRSALEFWKSEPTHPNLGVGGVELDSLGQFTEVQLGSLTLRPLAFHASPNSQEILLGWGPFRPLKTTLDFRRKRIWVEP
jgi:hypothetical protein